MRIASGQHAEGGMTISIPPKDAAVSCGNAAPAGSKIDAGGRQSCKQSQPCAVRTRHHDGGQHDQSDADPGQLRPARVGCGRKGRGRKYRSNQVATHIVGIAECRVQAHARSHRSPVHRVTTQDDRIKPTSLEKCDCGYESSGECHQDRNSANSGNPCPYVGPNSARPYISVAALPHRAPRAPAAAPRPVRKGRSQLPED